jgi:protein-S-isoprenylcysteine O-methyltransferase Ste14
MASAFLAAGQTGKKKMEKKENGKIKSDNPGVVIPPPFFYVAVFFLSLWAERALSIDARFLHDNRFFHLGAIVLVVLGGLIIVFAFAQFLRSGTAIAPVRPAKSLQTQGLYAFSRNPMYTGLLILYLGFAFWIGNWWTFLFIPLLVWIVQKFVIKKEEAYLEREFGDKYELYKKKVKRWL